MRKKRILTGLLIFLMLISGADTIRAQEPSFSDVPADAWYRDDLYACVEWGLIRGRTETTFVPQGTLTVAEGIKLAAVLHRVYLGGEPLKQGSPWYSVYLDYLIDCHILEDVPENPETPITRLAFAELIAAALPETEYGEINHVAEQAITDLPESESVYMLYRAGVLTGGADGAFYPERTLKRSEAAAILARAASAERRVRFDMNVFRGRAVVSTEALKTELTELTNVFRTEQGIAPLRTDEALDRAAALRAAELAESLTHRRPNGSSCFTALDECGAAYSEAGENIAAGAITAAQALKLLQEDGEENLLYEYDRMGVACVVAEDWMIYWVQVFAK